MAIQPSQDWRARRIPTVGTAGAPQPQPTQTATLTPSPKPVNTTQVAPGGNPWVPGSGPATQPVPTPPGPSTAPALPGTTTTPFGPSGDLRSTQVNPAGFDRPQAIGSYAQRFNTQLGVNPVQFNGVGTNVARRAVNPNVGSAPLQTDLSSRGTVDPADTADLAKFRAQRLTAADDVAAGSSRSDIARERLAAFDAEAEPAYQKQIRAVGQRAAELGRLGMGDTAVEALSPYTDYLSRRAALSHELAATTAEGEIGDRLDKLNASSGLVGQEEGIASGRRGELRGERDYATNVEDTNIGRRIGERDTALGLAERNTGRDLALSADEAALQERNLGRQATERDTALGLAERNTGRDFDARQSALSMALDQTGAQASDEASQRNELRGERDFQTESAQTALQNAIQGRQLESGEQSDEYNRALQAYALELGVDPSALLLAASNQFGKSAATSVGGATDIIGQILARRNAGA